jgi:hypothetical protein
VLRRDMERGRFAKLRPDTSLRLSSLWVSISNFRSDISLPDSYRDETRRYKNRQIGKTHDPHRRFFRIVHRTRNDSHCLFVLRTVQFRRLDDLVESRHVQQTELFGAMSARHPRIHPSLVSDFYDKVSHVHDRGNNVQRLDLVGQNGPQLESVF